MSPSLICTTCGIAFEAPPEAAGADVVAEESARCARLAQLDDQRKALEAARMQAGFAGVVDVDTADLVVHRENMSRLEAALRSEADEITRAMRHRRPG